MQLDLLPYTNDLARRQHQGRDQLWCPVRKQWLALQPEELVRQALIAYLRLHHYPLALMQVERKVGSSKDRLDLLVLTRQASPFMLVEVKAPGYNLQPAVQQLAHYNRSYHAPYALAVNGQAALALRLHYEDQRVETLAHIPAFPVDNSA